MVRNIFSVKYYILNIFWKNYLLDYFITISDKRLKMELFLI